jgi:hypothetical protein
MKRTDALESRCNLLKYEVKLLREALPKITRNSIRRQMERKIDAKLKRIHKIEFGEEPPKS